MERGSKLQRESLRRSFEKKRNILVVINTISGRLRGYPLNGSGQVRVIDKDYYIPGISIRSGQASISASGSLVHGMWDFLWDINARDIGELVPDTAGSVSAKGFFTGTGKPVVKATVTAANIRYKNYLIKTLASAFMIDLSDSTNSNIDLTMTGIEAGKRRINELRMTGEGRLSGHRVTLSAKGRDTSLLMSLKGGYTRKIWNGNIDRMDISHRQYGTWSLPRPAPLRLAKGIASTGICLLNQAAELCLQVDAQKQKGVHAVLTASRVPLGLFQPLLSPGLAITGTLNGTADVFYSQMKVLTGGANIRITNGQAVYALKGKNVRIPFRQSVMKMQSTAQAILLSLDMPFIQGGGITGRINISRQAGVQKLKAIHAVFTASRVPLDMIQPFLPPGLTATGMLNGKADVIYSQNNALTGNAGIRLTNGALTYALGAKKIQLNFRQGVMSMKGTDQAALFAMDMPFVEGGGITGRFELSRGGPQKTAAPAISAVKGDIKLDIPNLAILSAVMPAAKDVHGVFTAAMSVSGPLKTPNVTGRLAIEKASAALPRLGLNLTGITLTAVSAGSNRFTIDGSLHSGAGAISIKGYLARTRDKNLSAALGIKGENFQAIKTPEEQITISPDLNIVLLNKETRLTGALDIPQANIKVKDISGAVKPSPDVVVVGEEKTKVRPAQLKIYTDLKVILGDNIKFAGFGLTSSFSGNIAVHEEPGKVTTAQGEVVIVKGKYKAYGQDLDIRQGRLFFSGGPVDNPGLNVQATRTAENGVIAGVYVTGTLQSPKLAIFSEPPMDQTDALSYLILGKPLNSASSSQGNTLYGAASSAGLAGGALLAKKIGKLFGIQTSVEKTELKNTGQEQATLFLGRYLSPRLYVAYGVGIFETSNVFRVRYQLTKDWMVQTETGTETGGDVLFKLEWQ